jgi:hypothetical protein
MEGGGGDDFLYLGDDGFSINSPVQSGEEFPFPTDSPGTASYNVSFQNGTLTVDGEYQNFDGAPLFSQGETTADPTAIILNGEIEDANAFVAGFLRVPNDVEGNTTTGSHVHFSPAEDNRGDFADATVIRFFDEEVLNAKDGRITGEFELSPEEQAALLAGNFYFNLHTNVDLDGDGKGGFPTGENRTNINQNVIEFV